MLGLTDSVKYALDIPANHMIFDFLNSIGIHTKKKSIRIHKRRPNEATFPNITFDAILIIIVYYDSFIQQNLEHWNSSYW